jgi:hypothetical protein
MAKKIKTAAETTEKWARRTKGAVSDAIAGVNAVTEAPGVKAAAKKDKMKANLMAAIDNGTWEQRVKAVSVNEWREKTTAKMSSSMATGVDMAITKRQKFDNALIPAVEAARNKIQNMPDLTVDDNINRATTYMREMAKFKYKKSA